jgi:hypothetical protein
MILAPLKLHARRTVAAGLLLCSGAALADDRSEAIDRIMATGPIPCTSASFALFRQHVLDMFANAMMESVHTAVKPNDKWKPGNPDYERMLVMLKGALVESEARLGPIYTHTSGPQLVRSAFEALPAADVQYAARFFFCASCGPDLLELYGGKQDLHGDPVDAGPVGAAAAAAAGAAAGASRSVRAAVQEGHEAHQSGRGLCLRRSPEADGTAHRPWPG